MIFIAGISPKTKTLDENPRRCTICGLHQAYERRIDQYLSLFFIPVLRVKKGKPFSMCERCEGISPEFGSDLRHQSQGDDQRCRYCGKPLGSDFKYCPYCSRET